MPKTIVAHEQAISKIFSSDYVFNIPSYQRPYSWTQTQAQELFDDLLSFLETENKPVAEMSPYFLGSIVLIKNDASPEADVVDGQQRLTTLTILLSAIRNYVPSKDANDITSIIYERGSTILGTLDRYRLALRERDREFFKEYIQKEDGFSKLISSAESLKGSQENIRINAKLFSDKLQTLSDETRINLVQFIATRCFLVVVATPDLDSAYRIFSVLNSRGLDLSATDILKAEIIGKIHESKRDTYTLIWETIEDDLGRDGFIDLFSHIRMAFRKAKPKGTLLKEFKEHVALIGEPTRLIDEVIKPMSRAYTEILDAAYESVAYADEVNEYLRWLKRIEFSDWIPPALVYLSKNRQSPEKLRDFFRDMERLSFYMLVLKKNVNDRIERFSALTASIESEKNLWDEDSPLQLSPYEKNDFFDALNSSLYDSLSARSLSRLLLRIDALLSNGGAEYDYSRITVEHVLPRNPQSTSQWLTWFPDNKDRFYWVNRIGNLALLTRSKNSAASNYEFERKKSAYFSHNGISPFVLTTQVLSKPEWTIEVVTNRQKELLQLLESHWQLSDRKSLLDDL